jgi:hypothetical protein
VPGRVPREVAPHVWQWLADRVGRPVLAPYGAVQNGGGGLFVHSLDQTGWVSFRRGSAPAWRGKRFPRPNWDSLEFGQVRAAGFRGVAEPLPAGVWLRPDVGHGVLATARTRLTAALPCLPDAPLIVLGTRDALDLEVSDIVAFCRSLPPNLATAARFVRYGGVALPGGASLGQELADALGTEVFAYTGIPTGSPDSLDVSALLPDGSLGVGVFARAYTYRPGGGGAGRLCAHRAPVTGLSEVSPGVYWYAQGIVVEVVRAGLWVRPAEQITDPAGVRATPLDPKHNMVLYEESDRLRETAADLLNRLDEATRLATVLMPASALSGNILPGNVPPQAVPVDQAGGAGDTDVNDNDETDLPWLSRLMETMVMPSPARPSEVEGQDDRVRGTG